MNHRGERLECGADVRADPSADRPAGTSRTVGGYSAEKISPPVVTDVVSRARLHPLVTPSSGAPVTVVAAAAGWGKTIFAASWLRAGNDGRKGVWVSLEEADDDPHAFWCAVVAGLMPVVPARAAEALRRVAAGAVAAEELPATVSAALRLAPDPIAVVLDNLHEISSPEVHQGLVRLVERPPSNLSLLVTTRRDPPWPLPRLRLAGLVAEIRATDLAFRVDETSQLFTRLGVGVNRSQLERLVARTEGWPAGLRLVAAHLKGVDEPEAAVDAFSGDDHSVAGYLLTEVLDRE